MMGVLQTNNEECSSKAMLVLVTLTFMRTFPFSVHGEEDDCKPRVIDIYGVLTVYSTKMYNKSLEDTSVPMVAGHLLHKSANLSKVPACRFVKDELLFASSSRQKVSPAEYYSIELLTKGHAIATSTIIGPLKQRTTK